MYAAYAELIKESVGLAGKEVTAGDDFDIGKFHISGHMGMCDTAGTDNADS